MPTVTYPLDLTGNAVTNKIENELHAVSESNYRDYFFIVPNVAPFYVDNFSMSIIVSHVETPLVEGVHYDFALPYVAGTRSTGKSMYGGITLHNLDMTGVLKITYQCLGGDWVADRLHVLHVLAEKAYNPRTTIWDIVSDKPDVFPPIPHYEDFSNFYGMEELVRAIDDIRTWIAANRNEKDIIKHLADETNPHKVTLGQLGYTIATPSDVTDQAGPELLLSVQSIIPILEDIQGSIQDMQAEHATRHITPRLDTMPNSAYVGSERDIEITDYDGSISYVLAADHATLIRDGRNIHLRFFDSASTGEITVHGRVFTIPLNDPEFYHVKAIYNTPISPNKQYGQAVDTARNSTFIAIGTGDGSEVAVHNIQNNITLNTQAINKPDASVSDFGKVVKFSDDGSYLVMTGPTASDGMGGRVYLYTNSSGIFIGTQTINSGVNDDNGTDMDISSDGGVLVTTMPSDNKALVYAMISGSYVLDADIPNSVKSSHTKVCVSDDGNTIVIADSTDGLVSLYHKVAGVWTEKLRFYYHGAIGDPSIHISSLAISQDLSKIIVGVADQSTVYIYTRSAGTYQLDGDIKTDPAYRLGQSLIYRDGKIYVGAPGYGTHSLSPSIACGAVYVLSHDQHWHVEAKLLPDTIESSMSFGHAISMNGLGNILTIGSPGVKVSASNNAGVVYQHRQD